MWPTCNNVCLGSLNKASKAVRSSRDYQKSIKQVNKNILYAKGGGVYDLNAKEV